MSATDGARQAVNLLSRLERLPITPRRVGLIILLSLVWLAEAFDIGVVGPVLTTLRDTWDMSDGQMGLLAIASTLGVVIGMIPAGWLADRIGRRRVILGGIVWFSVLTLCGAWARGMPDLFLIRFAAGLGEGAVLPMPYLLLAEFMGSDRRGAMVGYANGILTAAYVVPSLASLWALHAFPSEWAWRVPFILGGVPLVLLIPLALWLPESPRYLLHRGKYDEVERLVESLEREAGVAPAPAYTDHTVALAWSLERQVPPPWRTLLRRPLAGRTLLVTAQLTAALILFYVLQVYGPALLRDRGAGTGTAILYSGLMMLVAGFGSVVQGYLSDRFGRKGVLALYVVLASGGCLLFAWTDDSISAAAAGLLTSFFGLGIFPVSKLCVAEQYPTQVRGRGVYLDELVARALSGIATTFFIPFVLDARGNQTIFFGIAVVLLLFSLPFLRFGRETAHLKLEQAAAVGQGTSAL